MLVVVVEKLNRGVPLLSCDQAKGRAQETPLWFRWRRWHATVFAEAQERSVVCRASAAHRSAPAVSSGLRAGSGAKHALSQVADQKYSRVFLCFVLTVCPSVHDDFRLMVVLLVGSSVGSETALPGHTHAATLSANAENFYQEGDEREPRTADARGTGLRGLPSI